jgi:5-(carboxyamino)imidazole ribonucleotide mutase
MLSLQMLAIEDETLSARLDAARQAGAEKVLEKNKAIEEKYNV